MGEQKRQQIMAAAESLFAARRFHEITMEEVARRAGVGKGTIYRYFEDKDALFVEVARSGYDALYETVACASESGDSFRVQLRTVCAGISTFFERRHQLFHMMQAEDRRMLWRRGPGREEWLSHKRRLTSGVGAVLARGREEGSVRGDLPLAALAVLLISMLRGRKHHGAEPSEALSSDQIAEVFLNGVGTGPGRER